MYEADWRSLIARVDRHQRRIVVSYLCKGMHARGERKGKPFHGFGRLEFQAPARPGELVGRGRGGFWDVNESRPELTTYKSVQLRRVTDEETIHDMTAGSERDAEQRAAKTAKDW